MDSRAISASNFKLKLTEAELGNSVENNCIRNSVENNCIRNSVENNYIL